jgi:hypothetical protein
MTYHVFGIRHHGPGSARRLVAALTEYGPDLVLVEGPPDANDILKHAARDDVQAPVALMVYEEADAEHGVFFPFAEYSPEWQAVRYALRYQVPARFMDLPQCHQQAIAKAERAVEPDVEDAGPEASDPEAEPAARGDADADTTAPDLPTARIDPIDALAAAAGDSDGERWWDQVMESQAAADPMALFDALREAMGRLRESHPVTDERELQREAWMRQTIRGAQRDGFVKIAVVCGAWHAPALDPLPKASGDAALLKGLPKVKVQCAWVPWSYDRLSFRSGYGAGVASPEWYHALWTYPNFPATTWVTRAARLLREADLDASSAGIIDAVRLADQLAGLRGRAVPGLNELLEAVEATLCAGHAARLALIRHRLVLGNRVGAIPDDMPVTPLAADLARESKRLRLPMAQDAKDYELDLRTPNDLARSHLLHRLQLLAVPWGRVTADRTRTRGTFRESWRLMWQPEFALAVVEASRFGTNVEAAATGKLAQTVATVERVDALSEVLESALLANLPHATEHLLTRLAAVAAMAKDVHQLMRALKPLATASRYGSVRQTDLAVLDSIMDGLITRILIGLPNAVASLDDAAAAEVQPMLLDTDKIILLLDHDPWKASWRQILEHIVDMDTLHGLVAGSVARLLADSGHAEAAVTAKRLSLALSRAAEPAAAAAWIEGFLAGGADALLHDDALRQLLVEWVASLDQERFVGVLPLLRRAFAGFAPAVRQQLVEALQRGAGQARAFATPDYDASRVAALLPILTLILGPNHAT